MNEIVERSPSPEGITSPSVENPTIISPFVDTVNPLSSALPSDTSVIVIPDNEI